LNIFFALFQLKNVSKQIGPRGFNGSQALQGPQGRQGVGNMSACIVGENERRGAVVTSGKIVVSYDQRTVSMFNLTNRFRFAVRVYCKRSHMMLEREKNYQ
jgi:hypothetical protein